MDEKETDEMLHKIWKETPAYLINWIREHSLHIDCYLSELNENLNEFLDDLNEG